MLALHLTNPSSSEAKVLAALLAHLADDVECILWLNGESGAPSTSACHDIGRPNVRIVDVPTKLPLDPAGHRSSLARLRYRAAHGLRRIGLVREARRLRPDLVYTSQQRFDCFLGELISRALRIPHVVHLHYTPGPELRRRALKRLRSCALVITVSAFIAERAIEFGVAADKVVVLPNTLGHMPPPIDRSGRTGPLTLGQVGRIVDTKGFGESVAAFAGLRSDLAGTELVLVGDGDERPNVEALAARLGVADRVQFLGWRSDVDALLEKFDVFIHPSTDEPFGLAVLEASAAGLPIVAYDDGGLPEVVAKGETGLLVPLGDIAALTAALETLIDAPALRARMGAAGRERVRTVFRPEDAGRRFSDAIRTLAAQRSARSARRAADPHAGDGQTDAGLGEPLGTPEGSDVSTATGHERPG